MHMFNKFCNDSASVTASEAQQFMTFFTRHDGLPSFARCDEVEARSVGVGILSKGVDGAESLQNVK